MGEEQMANTLISSLAFAACVSAFTPEYLTFSAPISQVPRSKTVMQETKLMTPDKLEKAFARFDVDGSGQVDLDEFTYKMKTLDMPFNDFELEQMFNEMDASANGGIDNDEFRAYVLNNAHVGVVRRLSETPDKIRELYDSFKGAANALELEAFQAGMLSLGMPYSKMELDQMFGEIDVTNNGAVDYEEFTEFMTQKVLPAWAKPLA